MLAQAGMMIVLRKGGPRDIWLAVANQNPLTWSVFDGFGWGRSIGAGVWVGALRPSPQGAIHEVVQVWINGDVQSCTLISLAELYDKEGIMIGTVEEKVNAQPNCGDGT